MEANSEAVDAQAAAPSIAVTDEGLATLSGLLHEGSPPAAEEAQKRSEREERKGKRRENGEKKREKREQKREQREERREKRK